MSKILIVGSGASAVHFALTVLQKGHEVTMLDVGYEKPDVKCSENSIDELKSNLEDPVDYFLGENFESFIPPDYDAEYYGFPPNKGYVLRKPGQFSFSSTGFAPLFSFAQGGLAEVWTGGAYPLDDNELAEFPFSFDDILPYYNQIADRIGVNGVKDDMRMFFPWHDNLMEPLVLDNHSNELMSRYNRKKNNLNNRLGFYMGRSRAATLSKDMGERKACSYTGRCLWGCPTGAFYTPKITLQECKKYDNFKYFSGMYVRHFKYDDQNNISSVVAESVNDSGSHEFSVGTLVLGAGTASSSKIFLESIFRKTGRVVKLNGLMDNRQILVPFLNLGMIGKPYDRESYQYNQIAFGIKTGNPGKHVHGQITTLKSALLHPIIQSFPFDLKTSVFAFRHLHSALGVLNLNFHDYRRDENYISLRIDEKSGSPSLLINYKSVDGEKAIMDRAMATLKKAFLKLGCVVPAKMAHIRPMGASVHYAGTIPFSDEKTAYTASKNCRSNDFNNLYFVDGTTFPFLPSKQLTFTMMANAVRVAEQVF